MLYIERYSRFHVVRKRVFALARRNNEHDSPKRIYRSRRHIKRLSWKTEPIRIGRHQSARFVKYSLRSAQWRDSEAYRIVDIHIERCRLKNSADWIWLTLWINQCPIWQYIPLIKVQ